MWGLVSDDANASRPSSPRNRPCCDGRNTHLLWRRGDRTVTLPVRQVSDLELSLLPLPSVAAATGLCTSETPRSSPRREWRSRGGGRRADIMEKLGSQPAVVMDNGTGVVKVCARSAHNPTKLPARTHAVGTRSRRSHGRVRPLHAQAGLAGNDRPRCVFASAVGRPKHVRVMPGGQVRWPLSIPPHRAHFMLTSARRM